MIDYAMILDFVITYLIGHPILDSYCVGYSWPASEPELFVCFPGKYSVVLAIIGVLVWCLCINYMFTGKLIPDSWIRFNAELWKDDWEDDY